MTDTNAIMTVAESQRPLVIESNEPMDGAVTLGLNRRTSWSKALFIVAASLGKTARRYGVLHARGRHLVTLPNLFAVIPALRGIVSPQFRLVLLSFKRPCRQVFLLPLGQCKPG